MICCGHCLGVFAVVLPANVFFACHEYLVKPCDHGRLLISTKTIVDIMNDHTEISQQPSLKQAFWVWLHIGVLSFGGPAAQIALIHREVVEKRQWLPESQYLNALNFCMLLPGPEAMQLASYVGWRLHGVLGGLMAGLLFVLPGAFVILTLAAIFIIFGQVPLIDAVFQGVQATVVVIVVSALLRVAQKSLQHTTHWLIATVAFVAIFFFAIPYPLVVIGAGIIGAYALQQKIESSITPRSQSLQQTIKTIVVWLLIWWLPVLCVMLFSGQPILSDIAVFFSKLAVVTFGGAYAVLAYMAQDVVGIKNWLTTHEMMTGLGLAETTPGPLILVTEFVGFLGAYREGGWWLGLAGAALTLWVTFVPCFLWIFVGGPYIEWISARPQLRGALSAITAAVVGVILSLSLWFALHVFFHIVEEKNIYAMTLWQPAFSSIQWPVILLTLVNGYVLLFRRWNIMAVLVVSSALMVLFNLVY